jgi:hypothetical protein
MNFRRGFQRAYVALTVIWIASVIFTGRWEPWLRLQQIEFLPLELVKESSASTSLTAPPITARFEDIDEAATSRMQTRQRWMWALGISVIPPLAIYLTLFYVLPWIYRGFRAAQQI